MRQVDLHTDENSDQHSADAPTRERRHALRWLIYTVAAFVPVPVFIAALIAWVRLTRSGPRAGQPLSQADWAVLIVGAAGLLLSLGLLRRRASYHEHEMRLARNEQVLAAHRAARLGDRSALSAGRERQMILGLIPAILTAVGLGLAVWLVL